MAELNLRMSAVTAIKRIAERVHGANLKACDISQLNQEISSLTAHFDRFVRNHEALVAAAEVNELPDHDLLFEQVESSYNETCIALNRKLLECKTSVSESLKSSESADRPTSASHGFDMRLDPVTIPNFDGSHCNWLAFKDVFETLVHNANFPEAYKLSKLRQAVCARNVPLVGGLYAGGYEDVWAALKNRFDNQRLLAEIHVSRFINMKAAVDETAKALLTVVDTVQESLRALKVMQLPVDQWDALAVPIIVSKLPNITRREWCMCSDSNKIPTLKELLQFLEKRAHSLSMEIGRVTQRPESSLNRTHHRNQNVKSCLVDADDGKCCYCQGPHRVARCQVLINMKPDQRFDALRHFGLCFNCLKNGHNSKQCPSGGCRHCGRKHHTLFCRGTSAQSSLATTTTVQSRDPSTADANLAQSTL